MAQYILAEEKDLVALPDELSYTDGAQVACGFGTVYEGLEKIGISGNDAGLGRRVGPGRTRCLDAGESDRAPTKLIGVDVVEERLDVAQTLGLADHVLKSGPDNVEEIQKLDWRAGSRESPLMRVATTKVVSRRSRRPANGARSLWSARVERSLFKPSPDMIHDQKDSLWLLGDQHLAHGRAG